MGISGRNYIEAAAPASPDDLLSVYDLQLALCCPDDNNLVCELHGFQAYPSSCRDVAPDPDLADEQPPPASDVSEVRPGAPDHSAQQPAGKRSWSAREHAIFLELLAKLGLHENRPVRVDGMLQVGLGQGVAKQIAEALGTRTPAQVRSHAQKHFQKMSRRTARRLMPDTSGH